MGSACVCSFWFGQLASGRPSPGRARCLESLLLHGVFWISSLDTINTYSNEYTTDSSYRIRIFLSIKISFCTCLITIGYKVNKLCKLCGLSNEELISIGNIFLIWMYFFSNVYSFRVLHL